MITFVLLAGASSIAILEEQPRTYEEGKAAGRYAGSHMNSVTCALAVSILSEKARATKERGIPQPERELLLK